MTKSHINTTIAMMKTTYKVHTCAYYNVNTYLIQYNSDGCIVDVWEWTSQAHTLWTFSHKITIESINIAVKQTNSTDNAMLESY